MQFGGASSCFSLKQMTFRADAATPVTIVQLHTDKTQYFVLGKAQDPLQTVAKQWEILHTLWYCNHANCVTAFLHFARFMYMGYSVSQSCPFLLPHSL